MKRQVLKFNDIKGMLSEDEMMGVVGGCGMWWDGHIWRDGAIWGSDGGTPSGGGSGGGGNPNSPDHILSGSTDGSGQGMTAGAFASWAIGLPEGTYKPQNDGTLTYSPLPQTGGGSVSFQIDSKGAYLFDGTVYTSEYGTKYNKVSFDGGTTWQTLAIGDATIKMPSYSQTRTLTGFTETYAFNDQQAKSFLIEKNSSNPSQEFILSILGFGVGLIDPPAGIATGIQSILHSGNGVEWQNIQNAYNSGNGLIINAKYSTPLMDGAPTRVTYIIKDGYGNELGEIIQN
ncbi:hypothetical protein [Pedobacter nototheniae]|uniref:hypothetical protein n=1 Tax=Pedobacter nototheniae TaxID=2488994 RepID=UPI002931ED2B|nr:hypothetical protein [Pedobacter nototheniae]